MEHLCKKFQEKKLNSELEEFKASWLEWGEWIKEKDEKEKKEFFKKRAFLRNKKTKSIKYEPFSCMLFYWKKYESFEQELEYFEDFRK
jgi:hypothetical protein